MSYGAEVWNVPEWVYREFDDRMILFDLLGERGGFKDTGGCICPYCFSHFVSIIDPDALNQLRLDRRAGKARSSFD